MKVSVRKTSNKKVIAQKPLTNLYEMNSNKDFIGDLTVNPTAPVLTLRPPSTTTFPYANSLEQLESR